MTEVEQLVVRLEELAATARSAVSNSTGVADHKLLILANYGDLALQLAPAFRAALSTPPAQSGDGGIVRAVAEAIDSCGNDSRAGWDWWKNEAEAAIAAVRAYDSALTPDTSKEADVARRIASYCEGPARTNVYKAAKRELALRASQPREQNP